MLSPGGRVGSARTRMIDMGFSGHGSSWASGISMGFSVGLFPWLNQSRIMNWSQLAASALHDVAALNSLRVITARLTSRGLGLSRLAVSGNDFSIGTLRPKRDPAIPMGGASSSL